MATSPPRFLFLGQLRRDFILPPSGRPYLDVPGGNTLYSAAGLMLWEDGAGLVARVGEDYPRAWLEIFNDQGLNTRGVQILPQALDLRWFAAYTDIHTRHTDNPIAHFAKRGLSFPRSLLNYQEVEHRLDSRTKLTPLSLRQSDLPPEFLHATAAHFCPLDYLTHSLMPAVLRQSGFTTITLDPSPGYMNPSYWDHVPAILTGLTAFLVSEEKARALFLGRSADLREMVEALGAYGPDLIVIMRGEKGQILYDAGARTTWEIPAYPARVVEPTGAGQAFCGGFLAGYRRTYDPVQAVLHGSVSASFTVEGSGAFYALDALPGLHDARLDVLKESIRKI
jgi:sugar/nucleoside kinase (ribokinase family)